VRAPAPTIEAVLFDMGGPVARTPFEMLRYLERSCGAPNRIFDWTGPFNPGADALWQQMQSGEITERDYWHQRAAQAAPFTGSPEVRRLFTLAFADPTECIRPEAMAMLDECQARGLRTGILTNDMRDFNEPGWSDRVEFVQRVDAVIDGSITGVLKPDPRAYETAVETLGVEPAATLFIDDQPFNIEGAQSVGLQTVWFDVTDPVGSYVRARARL
jgi:putative hydrolase of the HAD superfamily